MQGMSPSEVDLKNSKNLNVNLKCIYFGPKMTSNRLINSKFVDLVELNSFGINFVIIWFDLKTL